MNRDNVVSFADHARGRLARRGALDKLPFETEALFEVECPRCEAVTRVAADLPTAAEVACAACGATIGLREEVLDVRSR